MNWDGQERRINGERRESWVCPHHEAMDVKIRNNENGIRGMKKLLIIGLATIAGIISYYAYAQERNHAVLVKQTEIVTELKTIVETRLLPVINNHER